MTESGSTQKTIVALGELLIDFVPLQTGCSLDEVTQFQRVAGGAPANVAAAVARLGGKAALNSQVGEDAFGTYLIKTLEAEGVDTSGVFRTNKANTGLAFVSLDGAGNREFSFYRNPSADLFLSPEQLSPAMFSSCGVLHFCSVDLVDWPVRRAHLRAIELAREAGALISFDPNVRLPLWDDPDLCKEAIRRFLPFADVVKLSSDEVAFVTGCSSELQAAAHLFDLGCKLVVVTRAERGAAAYTPHASAEVEPRQVAVVDTTGAGDSFIGSFLHQLVCAGVEADDLERLSKDDLQGHLAYSAAYASLTVQREGAVMASEEELLRIL